MDAERRPGRDDDTGSRSRTLQRSTDRARRRLRRLSRLQLVLAGVVGAVGIAIGAGALDGEQDGPGVATEPMPPVVAELLAPAHETAQPMVVGAEVPTPARWAVPGGGQRTGHLWVEPGLERGVTVPVWLDASGEPAESPGTTTEAGVSGLVAGIGAVLGGWFVLAVLAAVARGRLAAADDRRWAAEWARVEPLWSGRVP